MWDPPPTSSTPTTDQLRTCSRPPELLPVEIESAIVATLVKRLEHDHRLGNDHRERELLELFAQLTPVQNLDLRRRIASQRANDEVAQAFKRLVVERRRRLVSFLEDPRRRLARKSLTSSSIPASTCVEQRTRRHLRF